MNISILICAYGAPEWADLAWSRAYPSTLSQGARESLVIYRKDATLAQVRNLGAQEAVGDWLLFLDADDELANGYVTALEQAQLRFAEKTGSQHGALLTPRVSYQQYGQPREPAKFWPEQDIRDGNWMVIGTALHRTIFMRAGGFREWPVYEDWCLFQRCYKVGALPIRVPEAIYVAHVSSYSRNRTLPQAERTRIHHEIRWANFPELYE